MAIVSNVRVSAVTGVVGLGMMLLAGAVAAGAPLALQTAPATRQPLSSVHLADGTVEAARRVTLSAQVPGRITRLDVRAGDRVARGQVIARVDERAASQQASASSAQVAAANAALEAARSELARTERLYGRQYVSQAAMERAKAQFDAAAAQARATIAQAGAATTVTTLHTVVAPFAGVVSRTMVEQGDMAMPDKPLVELFDPEELRVTAMLPESVAAGWRRDQPVVVRLTRADEAGAGALPPLPAVLMPTADPVSHTFELRVPLPGALADGLVPGRFARVEVSQPAPAGALAAGRLTVPAVALVRRTEFTGVYVLDTDGRPRLRQVRAGRVYGDRVEVLAGLAEGEQVALDPAAAARRR